LGAGLDLLVKLEGKRREARIHVGDTNRSIFSRTENNPDVSLESHGKDRKAVIVGMIPN